MGDRRSIEQITTDNRHVVDLTRCGKRQRHGRPITFSGAMVRAIMDGTKTQTRRLVKDQGRCLEFDNPRDRECIRQWGEEVYGSPGDTAWVRESFYCDHYEFPTGDVRAMKKAMYYRADGLPCFDGHEIDIRWRPSTQMPRWASRITLIVTGIRVERLNDISATDVEAEGLKRCSGGWWDVPHGSTSTSVRGTHIDAFREFFGNVNGIRLQGASNPIVWVIDFGVVQNT